MHFDAKSDLLSIVGSWGDTMDDQWVLDALKAGHENIPPISGRPGVTRL